MTPASPEGTHKGPGPNEAPLPFFGWGIAFMRSLGYDAETFRVGVPDGGTVDVGLGVPERASERVG